MDLNNIVNCPYCKHIYSKNNLKIHFKNCEKKKKYDNNILRSGNSLVSNISGIYMHFFKKYDDLFKQYLQNKTVALIGPAESIIGTNKGNIIDKFDVIIRLNKSLPLPQNLTRDIGSRTDVLYNSLNTSDFPGENRFGNKLLEKEGVKFLCCPYPYNHSVFKSDIKNYIDKNKFGIPFKVMNDGKYFQLENYLKTRPYTGTAAILDLLNYPIKYLYISGLDFYMTSYYSSYRRIKKSRLKNIRNNIIHNNTPQIEYLRDLYIIDDRIILDNFLDINLFKDYYSFFKELISYKSTIFKFDDYYLEKFFELDKYLITYTLLDKCLNKNDSIPYIILSNNSRFEKKENEYLLYVTNNSDNLILLNKDLDSKKYIGNFYFNNNKKKFTSMYIDQIFLIFLKNILKKVKINNCNIHLIIFFSIIAYTKNNYFFNMNEILERWKLDKNEKKLILFLKKKKLFNYF